ncbi:hypothetical protein ACOSP7_007389 [Xanthoceras sorbifolium]|uniref:Uncharacterized protein n=1 Tax=Xanthoceras sorbifolium TaxID=99658 RepID=A0ABQ8IAH7_9ROSI|nr:hypothetical protein JRO89_XS03G0181000 [Xanthoceras sorbifolium]
MFNFVCKTLLLHYGRRYTITSSSNYTVFSAFPIFIKWFSNTTTAPNTSNQHSFAVSYLINSCGFSPQSALSASKRVHFDSPEKAESVIDLFKSHGFSETQVLKVIRAHPQVLCSSPEDTLLPKLQFFYSKGFSGPEIAKIFSACPTLLLRSVENHLVPSFNDLNDLFQSSERTVAVLKCCPYLLHHDIESWIGHVFNILRDIGVPEPNIVLYFTVRPRFFKTSLDSFRDTVEAVKEIGFSPLHSQFILAVVAKEYSQINWESKVEIYRRWGWSDEEFSAAFRKNPKCMLSSTKKIMTVMDFLVNKMDLEPSVVANRPDVIPLSMEKRFIPRAAVFQFLVSKGLIERKDTNLITFFTLPEKSFLRKFVKSFDEAPELLKLYEEKLGRMVERSVSKERDA